MIINNNHLYVACSRCDGGRLASHFYDETEGEGGTVIRELEPCKKCGGRGVVKIALDRIREIGKPFSARAQGH